MKVLFERLSEFVHIPEKSTEHAACVDVYLPQDYPSLEPGEIRIVPLGFCVRVPDGYELQVRPRSGLASRGIMVANSPGCIDPDYRGEVGVILHNQSTKYFPLKKGNRVCQMKLSVSIPIEFEEVSKLEPTSRGSGGFGSTGR